jgi:hypothetical protein
VDYHSTASYVLSGMILWGVSQLNYQMRAAAKWRRRVDDRLSQIELVLKLNPPRDP